MYSICVLFDASFYKRKGGLKLTCYIFNRRETIFCVMQYIIIVFKVIIAMLKHCLICDQFNAYFTITIQSINAFRLTGKSCFEVFSMESLRTVLSNVCAQLGHACQLVYNNSIPIPHIKAVVVPLWCAELECYCCNQMVCAAKLRKNITEDRP